MNNESLFPLKKELKFGHYEKDCNNPVCCGYCCSHDHKASDCDVSGDDQQNYKCVNCEEKGKDPTGHSSLWYKNLPGDAKQVEENHTI